jgi:membrane protease YdiL (CAAX protease family)
LMPVNKLLSFDNHLFELARQGRLRLPATVSEGRYRVFNRFVYPPAVLIFSLFVPIMSAIILAPFFIIRELAGGSILLPSFYSETGVFLVMLVAGFLPFYLFVWIWLWLLEQRPPRTTGLEWPGWLAKYGRGLLIGLLMFGGAIGIMAVLGYVSLASWDPAVSRLLAGGGSLVLLLGWIVQGGAEELLLRGFLFPVIGVRFGMISGILISSSVFTLLHLLNPNLTALAVLNLFLFGVFASLFALYEGGLWGIFAIHTVWNWAQGNLFGLSVSGGELSSATFLRFSLTGPDWLTGGKFGPEGGLAVTAVTLTGCILLFGAARRRRMMPDQAVVLTSPD